MQDMRVALVGGRGMLGRAFGLGLMRAGMPARNITVFSRSDQPLPEGLEAVALMQDYRQLAARCDLAVLLLPPAQARTLRLDLAGKPVLSVMAGIDLAQLARIAPEAQLARAMSSPAAEQGLAYSPWVAGAGLGARGMAQVGTFLGALGQAERLENEELLALFTALTGPVPGFVALFAEMMQDYLVARGVAEAVADRAIRQLFLGAGQMMAHQPATASAHVRDMLAYGGTTAAGLQVLRDAPLRRMLFEGLDAAAERARSIGLPSGETSPSREA
ncbi:pyrroline-5-carboxylate reductase family protein [Thioclava sp. GXIMD4215]|uniref:pyrroline-5-carboxylate reductase family protein n=1 Tax=Thioclava sp. GXIMD4215 TaxID=3131928 RepID=UPI003247D590